MINYVEVIRLYGLRGGHNFEDAIKNGILECMILKAERKATKHNQEYMVLSVTDGLDDATVMVWANELADHGEHWFQIRTALNMRVKWNDRYNSFSVTEGSTIYSIPGIAEQEDVLCYQTSMVMFPYLDDIK